MDSNSLINVSTDWANLGWLLDKPSLDIVTHYYYYWASSSLHMVGRIIGNWNNKCRNCIGKIYLEAQYWLDNGIVAGVQTFTRPLSLARIQQEWNRLEKGKNSDATGTDKRARNLRFC